MCNSAAADSAACVDALSALADVIETRLPQYGSDPQSSYVAQLLHKGSNTFLKKIGEEATEVIIAAKAVDAGAKTSDLVCELADLWFHSMVAMAHYGLRPQDVVDELKRREGISGITEKAQRSV